MNRTAVWLLIASLFLLRSALLHAACLSGPDLTTAHEADLRNTLANVSGTQFRLLSEAASSDGKLRFVLYSLTPTGPSGVPAVYLAVMGSVEGNKAFSAREVSRYVPLLARSSARTSAQGANIDGTNLTDPVSLDGCVNAFVLNPNLQAIHLNLFARSRDLSIEGANDVVLVMPTHGSKLFSN